MKMQPVPGTSGDTTPCEVAPVILHGLVYPCKVTPVILHRVVSPEDPTKVLRVCGAVLQAMYPFKIASLTRSQPGPRILQ